MLRHPRTRLAVQRTRKHPSQKNENPGGRLTAVKSNPYENRDVPHPRSLSRGAGEGSVLRHPRTRLAMARTRKHPSKKNESRSRPFYRPTISNAYHEPRRPPPPAPLPLRGRGEKINADDENHADERNISVPLSDAEADQTRNRNKGLLLPAPLKMGATAGPRRAIRS